jgi:EmrB/QacA subfamily drug resistance transporter
MLTEPRRPAAVRESPHAHWYAVATVCIGAFMGQLDASIVTLALPRLGSDLNVGAGAVEWVALAYLLVLVATVATVGRIADAAGRKLLYVYGFGVFTAGSVICGFAETLPVLIAARGLQAVGAAMLQANSVALIAETVPRPLLGRAIGVQGSAQALGLALGPAIGGVLLSLGGWRLIFLVNLPAGLIGLVLGWLLLPRSRTRRPIEGSDWPGAVLLALAAAGALLYLSLGTGSGYSAPAALAVLAGGSLAAVGFVRRERSARAPLIDLSILRRPALATGLAGGLVCFLVLFGTLYVVPYYLSAGHVPAGSVGVQVAVPPVALGIAAPIGGRLLGRFRAGPLTVGGLALAAAGMFEIAVWHGTLGLLAGLALIGLGLGMFIPANNATIMLASPPGHTGVVSGILNMTRGFGTALGVAVAGAVYASATASGGATHGLAITLAALGVLALATSQALRLGTRNRPPAN